MQTVLVNTAAVFSVTFYADEVSTAADGTVTVTVTSVDGTVIQAATPATHVGVAGNYTWSSAAFARVDILNLAWTGVFAGVVQTATTTAEVVGGFYASIPEIRSADASLQNTTTWTSSKLADKRAEAEAQAEAIMGRAYVRRLERETTYVHRGRVHFKWPTVRTIRAITVDSVVASVAELAAYNLPANRYLDGYTLRSSWSDGAYVDVVYEHGADRMDPELPAVIAQLTRIKCQQPMSNVPDRAERFTTDGSGRMFVLSSPGADRTGIPAIDAVLWRKKSPAIA